MTNLDDATFRIEFHRCLDGVVYSYKPAGVRNHRPCWRRVDLALHLHWTDRSGWIISDEAGAVLSRPWDFERDEQGPLPPEGIWVSRKHAKSYVYEHRHVRAL